MVRASRAGGARVFRRTMEAAGEKVYPAAILALVSGDFSQIEFGGTGRMCAKGTEINVTGAGLGIRPSGAAALFELLAAAAGAWLVPPDLLPGDRRHRCFTQYASQVRHLAEGQPCAADVDLGLAA